MPEPESPNETPTATGGTDRRRLLRWFGIGAMTAGLVAGYGAFAAVFGRFLYPARPGRRGWLYVTRTGDLAPGDSLPYQLPDGQPITLLRRGEGAGAEDFLALSSTCPHLGCQVHWQPQNERFFCPCHNGVFTPDGIAVSGPPADAGQSLPPYPLKVENGLVFLQVPLDHIADQPRAGSPPAEDCRGCPPPEPGTRRA